MSRVARDWPPRRSADRSPARGHRVAWNKTASHRGQRQLRASPAPSIPARASATLGLALDHFRDDYGSAYFGTPIVPRGNARQPSAVVKDSRGFVLDEAMRDQNYDVNGGITDIRTTWGRANLNWQISPLWKLANDFYVYDKAGDWKNAEVYSFAPASALLTRSTVSIGHDHQFYGNRLALASDARIGTRRNRFTIGLEANRNDFSSPRRFGSTTPVDPYNPVRGVFPADTPENFPGAGNRQDFASTINLVSVFAEDALTVVPRVTLIGGLRVDRFDVDRSINDLNTGTTTAFSRSFHPISGRAGVVFDPLPRHNCSVSTVGGSPGNTVALIRRPMRRSIHLGGVEGGVAPSPEAIDATARCCDRQNDAHHAIEQLPHRDPGRDKRPPAAPASVNVPKQGAPDRKRRVHESTFVALIDPRRDLPPGVPARTAGLWRPGTPPDTFTPAAASGIRVGSSPTTRTARCPASRSSMRRHPWRGHAARSCAGVIPDTYAD